MIVGNRLRDCICISDGSSCRYSWSVPRIARCRGTGARRCWVWWRSCWIAPEPTVVPAATRVSPTQVTKRYRRNPRQRPSRRPASRATSYVGNHRVKSEAMRRRLFTAASLLSLLLFLVTIALWVRSYGRDQVVYWRERLKGPAVPEMSRLEMTFAERTMDPRYQRPDVSRFWYDSDYELHVCCGRVGFGWMVDACVPRLNWKGPVVWERMSSPRIGVRSVSSPASMWGASDFLNAYGNSVQREVKHTLGRSIPVWPFAVCTMILPVIWVVRRVRSRRRAGHCAACHYNLTGNTSGVCPECGVPISSSVIQGARCETKV
jgi:hypothetical protein